MNYPHMLIHMLISKAIILILLIQLLNIITINSLLIL